MISETRPALRRVRQTPRAPGRLQRAHRTVSSVIKYDPRGCACRRSSASAWPPRLGLPRVLGRSIRTTAVKRVCRGYFPLIHIVFSDPLASERFPRILGGEGGLKKERISRHSRTGARTRGANREIQRAPGRAPPSVCPPAEAQRFLHLGRYFYLAGRRPVSNTNSTSRDSVQILPRYGAGGGCILVTTSFLNYIHTAALHRYSPCLVSPQRTPLASTTPLAKGTQALTKG